MAQRSSLVQEMPSSDEILDDFDDFFTETNRISSRKSQLKWRSKSLDDFKRHRQKKRFTDDDEDEIPVSNTTRTECDLTTIGCDSHEEQANEVEEELQQSRSAPVSPSHIYDKDFASFLQSEQQQQQILADSFVYNVDLSDIKHQPQSRATIFDDDDDEFIVYVAPPSNNHTHSNLINSCLTITEENEEELEQLRRDDDEEQQQRQNHHYVKLHDSSDSTAVLHDDDDRADILENDDSHQPLATIIMNNLALINRQQALEEENERLSTIYESPSPPPRIEEEGEEEIYDDAYDKLIVYDIALPPPPLLNDIKKKDSIISTSHSSPRLSSYHSPLIDRTRIRPCYTDATVKLSPSITNTQSASNLCGTTTMINSKVFHPPTSISMQRTPSPSTHDEKSSSSPVINVRQFPTNPSLNSLPTEQKSSPTRSSPMSVSVPMLLLPITNEFNARTSPEKYFLHSPNSPDHIQKTTVIQSSSSSLSDFLLPTGTPTLKSNSSHYEEVPSVHHSLTDCSLMQQISCCTAHGVDDDGNSSKKHKSSEDNSRRPSFTRRILTNGLLLSHCSNNSTYRRVIPPAAFQHQQQSPQHLNLRAPSMKPKSEEKLTSYSSPDSSSSSQSNSPTADKIMSRSDFVLQHQDHLSQQRKATSLKSIRLHSTDSTSKILYPIDFDSNQEDSSWYQKRSSSHENKVPTSDSGIVIDTAGTRPASKSSIDENDGDVIPTDTTNSSKLKQYEQNYRQTLTDLTLIKKNIVDIESRLSEAMRELEIERALVEGEHELVFKQILDASECDQDKLRHLYDNLQLLIARMMTEKTTIRAEIEYTQEILFKLEDELHGLEQDYRPNDDKILKKKEIILEARKKQEDLEFQFMELETRCEAELEQAELNFQNERLLASQNAKLRQNTLRDLDHQQQVILHQATMEKEKLEREKQKLKSLFKQKKFEANELEQKINQLSSTQVNGNGFYQASPNRKDSFFTGQDMTIYHSTPSNLYSSLNQADGFSSAKSLKHDDHQEKLNEIKEMIAVAKLEKMSILEQQLRERYNELVQCQDEHLKRVELEEKLANEIQHRDYLVERQVKLREKTRLQERPLTRYLPIRSMDFDLRSHIEGAGHLIDSRHIHLTSTSCRGFLHKMGGMKFKTWNRRWFVFDRKRRTLFYYQDKSETKLRGCIYFQSIVEVYVDHLQSMSLRSPEPREATFIVKTFERPFYLVAPTVESMRIWVDVLITGAEGNSFAGDT